MLQRTVLQTAELPLSEPGNTGRHLATTCNSCWLQHRQNVATTGRLLQPRQHCCNHRQHVATTGNTLQKMRIEREMQRLREMEYEFAQQSQDVPVD